MHFQFPITLNIIFLVIMRLCKSRLIDCSEPEQVIKAVGELQHVTRPVPIKFSEMIGLMEQCKQLEDIVDYKTYDEAAKNYTMSGARGILANNPFTLLSGIIPGKCATEELAIALMKKVFFSV